MKIPDDGLPGAQENLIWRLVGDCNQHPNISRTSPTPTLTCDSVFDFPPAPGTPVPLLSALPPSQLPLDIQQNIDIDSYRIYETGSGDITLDHGNSKIHPQQEKSVESAAAEEIERLSKIIEELNERFGVELDEEPVREFRARLEANPAIMQSIKVNTPEAARLSFEHVANDELHEMVEPHFKFYQALTNEAVRQAFFDFVFEQMLQSVVDENAA